ncbi:hypothetical protein LSM04_006761 [Trypanosoma melophagium]|uniref:uncharacterized protein n=1 Tax=Trypanosoma melophagium TaxID=715481 RepID=UPI00351A4D33|nr:hypothetical protein LSM04_006761 [Trypanosoma melophagium]
MNRFSRLRSDGALSIDLGEAATGGTASSNVFTRNDHEVVVPTLNHSPTRRSSNIYGENLSSSTATLTSPCPRIPFSTERVEFNMEERLSLEEEWRLLRECTFNPHINPRSRHIVASARGEVDDGTYSSITQRRGSQQIFQKLYDDAKEHRDKLERLRAAKEVAEEERERREMQPEYTSSPGISPRRKTRSGKESPYNNADIQENDNDNANSATEVFERLYADASFRRRVKAKGILKHQEENKNREKKEMEEYEEGKLSPERRKGQSQGEEAPKMTEAERKEFFARLSVPIRRREKSAVTIHEEVTTRWEDKEESRLSSLQWPLPFLQPLTLADLERHNEMASRQRSRVVS